MDKQILNFTANEQILVCENPIKISTNKVNYIQNHFDLGENWDGFDSVRAVWFNDFNCISTVLDSLGNCVVPFEVMKRKGNVKVNLVGSISEDDVLTDRLTSYPVVAVIVDCTAQITGANTSPITPSEYEQFVAAVHEDAERAEAGATASEQSASNSEASAQASATSASNASISENNARVSERNAEVYKNQAHEEAQNASESATDAEGYAEDAESARDTILGMRATANTLSEGSDATASYSNGLLTLGIPRGNTGAKGDKGDRGDVGATPNLSIGTVTTLEPTEDATATISGTAEEPILSFGIPKGDTGEVSIEELEDATIVQTLSDSTPYNYRRTNNGNGSGTREYDEIVGASVAWNQLFVATNSPSSGGITFTADSDNKSETISGTATRTVYLPLNNMVGSVSGHVYYVDRDTTNTDIWIYNDGSGVKCATDKATVGKATANKSFYLRVANGATVDETITPQITDLTLALGSAIADYVASLETATAGSGVAWLKTHFPKLFDNGYQPFDSGSIKSVGGLTAHEMVGVNLWDEEWESGAFDSNGQKIANTNRLRSKNFIPIFPNTTYYFYGNANTYDTWVATYFYDGNGNFISSSNIGGINRTFVTPSDANVRYMMFNTSDAWSGHTYDKTLAFYISDSSINGQYFPHEKHTYTLDSSVTLRGRYKLDANNQLYADGDVWKSDSTLNRKYAEISLGDLNWAYTTTDATSPVPYFQTPSLASTIKYGATLVCSKYASTGGGRNTLADKTIAMYNMTSSTTMCIADSAYTDATSFAQHLTDIGAKLVYELATPTTEQATPYTSPQWCDSHGTEEYVGSELPVGHNTDYPMTLIDTADGLSNGTYEPRITVANGKKTVTWVSV